MPFDWREYYWLACELQGEETPTISWEANDRCTISRAYYAAFRLMVSYARDKDFVPGRHAEDHSGIRRWMANHGFGGLIMRLNDLKVHREYADYEDDFGEDTREAAVQALADAKYIIRLIPGMTL